MDRASTPTADRPPAAPTPAPAGVPPARPPEPPSERWAWLLAGGLGLIGVAVLVVALTGGLGNSASSTAPPPVVISVAAPPRGNARLAGVTDAGSARRSRGAQTAIVAAPTLAEQQADERSFINPTQTHISRRWMEGFYPIYEVAQQTFGVNWLLIASIHRQETAFSTAAGTYHGLNFAGCCGGPMQFNVKNGPVTTWQLVEDSYVYGRRPATYNHMTKTHPSIYDDFDSIMAAAHLLSVDGAEYALNGSAWDAAYDYYGHDATGVTYADQVLARAIGWSQHGFCINCGTEASLIEAVNAAYGAPVLEELQAAEAAEAKAAEAKAAEGKSAAGKSAAGKSAEGKAAKRKAADGAPAASAKRKPEPKPSR